MQFRYDPSRHVTSQEDIENLKGYGTDVLNQLFNNTDFGDIAVKCLLIMPEVFPLMMELVFDEIAAGFAAGYTKAAIVRHIVDVAIEEQQKSYLESIPEGKLSTH